MAETKRRKAVEFLKRVGKPEAAELFAEMTPEHYAAHKHAELIGNPFQEVWNHGARNRPDQSRAGRAD